MTLADGTVADSNPRNDHSNTGVIAPKATKGSEATSVGMLNILEKPDINSIESYKINVHGIKGTSLDIYAEPVGHSAKSLENAAKASDINFINENNPGFFTAIVKLISDIENWIAKIDAENPRPKKDKPDSEVLVKLLNACKDYDMDGADTAMAEIEKYQYDSDDGLADWLRENIDRMNLKQIAEKLGGM